MTQKTKTVKHHPLVVVTTGGSGGHIFPAQAVADALLKKGYRVVFVTDKRGQAFPGLDSVKTYRLMADKVMGRSFFHKMAAAFKLYCGAVQALFLLKRLKPMLVVGVGGYASLPTVLAAQLWRIPVVLHEQNAVLGRANRVLAPHAKVIATSFDPTMRIPAGVPAVWVGMPVRPMVLAHQKTPYVPAKDVFHLLIFGGSQGARFFSVELPKAFLLLPEEIKKRLKVTQQVRPENLKEAQQFYQTAGIGSYTLDSFFTNMPALMASAHLVIGRGGASTLSELMVIGRPGIIVPLPTSADNHQTENARRFCDAGAGWLVAESSFEPESFARRLAALMSDNELLMHAAVHAADLAKPAAAAHMADLCQDIIKE